MFFVENAQGYDDDHYKEIKDYFVKSEVPLLQRKIIQSYLSRLDNLISLNFKTKLFADYDDLTPAEKVNYIIIIYLERQIYYNQRSECGCFGVFCWF
jgi:hypothetical protein